MVDTHPAGTEGARTRIGALVERVRGVGGVARTATLHAAGHTRRTLDLARSRGALVSVRRGWVAVPGADPHLVAAARHGVVLSCVTQAERLGLFVLRPDARPHVAAPAHAGHAAGARAHIHWARPVVAKHPDALVDVIENVLVLAAGCLPFEEALVVWESALTQGRIDRQVMRRLTLPAAARKVLEAADVFSDSGLETLVVPRLRWLKLPLRRQIWIAEHRVDLLIGKRLVLQVDGGHHVGLQRERDLAHDAQLMLLGYHVIRVGYTQVLEDWPAVQDMVMRAVAQGLHLDH